MTFSDTLRVLTQEKRGKKKPPLSLNLAWNGRKMGWGLFGGGLRGGAWVRHKPTQMRSLIKNCAHPVS